MAGANRADRPGSSTNALHERLMTKFFVNGEPVSIQADPETPLLWILREELGLTGTKYGCGISECGACTVHVDGKAERSCSIALEEVAERHVVTIEGLGGGELHPVQMAWLDEDVVQCGYCQPGQIMQAAALLQQNPSPSDDEIERWMAPMLCRCGTYERIRRAVRLAASRMSGKAVR